MKKYFVFLLLIASCNGLSTSTLNYKGQNNPIEGDQAAGNVNTENPDSLQFISRKALLKAVLGESIKIRKQDKDDYIKIIIDFEELRELVEGYKEKFEASAFVEDLVLDCLVDEYANELSPEHLFSAVSINYPKLVEKIAPHVDVHVPVYDGKTSFHKALFSVLSRLF